MFSRTRKDQGKGGELQSIHHPQSPLTQACTQEENRKKVEQEQLEDGGSSS